MGGAGESGVVRPVVCFALVTNQMAQCGDDFAKGLDNGTGHARALVAAAARGWRTLRAEPGGGINIGETP